jgi:hypothetical protein
MKQVTLSLDLGIIPILSQLQNMFIDPESGICGLRT